MAKESSSTSDLLDVDEFYFSALLDENPNDIFPLISDSKYAEELQLQEAIMASLITIINSQTPNKLQQTPKPEPPLLLLDHHHHHHQISDEIGEPSQIFCEICTDRKESDQMFKNKTCTHHSFCTDCINKHVAAKIQDNNIINMNIMCPGLNCKGVLEPDTCKTIIPENVMARWDEAISESMILGLEKFYCPYKDCSAMMSGEGDEVMNIREAECPVCRRLFCAKCYVPWHAGVECEEFERLNEDERGKDDLMVMELAKEKKWRRCPKCMFYVEKLEGCLHIVCRCKFEFCYGCGADWTQHHGGCQ